MALKVAVTITFFTHLTAENTLVSTAFLDLLSKVKLAEGFAIDFPKVESLGASIRELRLCLEAKSVTGLFRGIRRDGDYGNQRPQWQR